MSCGKIIIIIITKRGTEKRNKKTTKRIMKWRAIPG
jgi:DNA gyrase inhibitor GyrI